MRFREHFCEDMAPLPDDLPRRSGLRREFASFEDNLAFKVGAALAALRQLLVTLYETV